ncbi:HAMP domain-containing histidine kinase [Lysobacter sp. N42]|nr:HAMP domain-containing histidine kinase [Aliidiomarina sp. B3213]TCZ89632.1 HAMP domain-containing histidine kinase [Lysobacter sp. N42]
MSTSSVESIPQPVKGRNRTSAAARVKSLVHAMPNGVVLLDARGIVREVNDEATRLLGDPLLGTRWRDVIDRAFRPQADDGHEVSLYSGRRVRLDISSLSPEPGQLIVLTDLSETRALLSRISHLQRLTAMGKMVASLAHQIRTPLSAAMLYAEGLQREELGADQRKKFAGKLNDRLLDLESQLNDMLLYAKSGEQQPVKRLSIRHLLDVVHGQTEGVAEQHHVKLVIEQPQQDVFVIGNENALAGALQNLIVNAIQASSVEGEVTVQCSASQTDVKLTISDQGCGIPQNVLHDIFTPFFTNKQHGTGLGLAVVKTVMNAHQGSVDVHSEEGKGTRFELCLPQGGANESQ